MRCYNHSEREGANTCSYCGTWMCDDCAIEINGRLVCKKCVGAIAASIEDRKRGHHGHHPHGHGGVHIHGPRHFHGAGRSRALLFLLSFLPGLGYMYLGLIKRGLAVMVSFFTSIFLLEQLGISIFAFLIPVILFASMFDGFRILRLMDEGIKVEDTIDDLTGFFRPYKVIIIGLLAATTLTAFARNFLRVFFPYLWWGVDSYVPFVLVMVLVIVLITGFKKRRKTIEYHKEDPQEDYIDKR